MTSNYMPPAQWADPARLAQHQGDRIRKALEVSGVGVGEMSEWLGVNRNTVSGWISRRHPVSRQSLRLIALRTGVPLQWLETGDLPAPPRLTGCR